jgi:hypothetical protein
MKRLMFLVVIIFFFGCSDRKRQETAQTPSDYQVKVNKYVWTKLLDSADWKKSYNFQMFSLKDTLWVFHFDGNWYSVDGKEWRKSLLPNAVGSISFVNYVQFKNAVYGLGHFEGNIEKFSLQNCIYRTSDLQHWDTISKSSTLPRRFFITPSSLMIKSGSLEVKTKTHSIQMYGTQLMDLPGKN